MPLGVAAVSSFLHALPLRFSQNKCGPLKLRDRTCAVLSWSNGAESPRPPPCLRACRVQAANRSGSLHCRPTCVSVLPNQPGPAPASRGGGAGVQASGRVSGQGSGVGRVEGRSPSGGVDVEGAGLNLGLQGWGGQSWTLHCRRWSVSRIVAAQTPQLRWERPPRTFPEINVASVCARCLTFCRKSVLRAKRRPCAGRRRLVREASALRPWLPAHAGRGGSLARCGPRGGRLRSCVGLTPLRQRAPLGRFQAVAGERFCVPGSGNT